MAARYDDEAIAFCQRMYLKFNGQHVERIEAEVRKVYPGWRRQYLYTRGKGKHQKLGWIDKYGWEKALQLHLVQKPTAALNSAQQLVNEIERIRQQLDRQIAPLGAVINEDSIKIIQLHRDYCNLSIAALTKVQEAKDTLGAWVNFWEKLIDWAVDVDVKLARALQKHSEAIIARAETEFGETELMLQSAKGEGQSGDANRDDAERAG